MIFCIQLLSLLIFAAVISAVAGFLFHELTGSLLRKGATRYFAGACVSVIASVMIIKLLRLDAWYYYGAAVAVTLALYMISVKSINRGTK